MRAFNYKCGQQLIIVDTLELRVRFLELAMHCQKWSTNINFMKRSTGSRYSIFQYRFISLKKES